LLWKYYSSARPPCSPLIRSQQPVRQRPPQPQREQQAEA
jgi:hypothetical protein